MNITQDIQKWGNSSGVRLPKKVIEAAHMRPNQTVSITIKGRSIVLTPIHEDESYTLDSMLEGVTLDNVHTEEQWGDDLGLEKIDE